ncbi:hypothetical protein [Dactylosporangium sp. NPDC005555]|uniref:hypothetical protein n=1 Tax=Dactylosporangium sp. NPDC005555 TaxID=3154889 RepID=UPI0033A07520
MTGRRSEVLFLGGRSGVGKTSVAVELHVERSDAAARSLDASVPASVHRMPTDERTIPDIAADILALTGWCR